MDGLRIERMHARLRLPAQQVLDRGPDHTLVTEESTSVGIFLDAEALTLTLQPPLRFVLHPASAGVFAHLVEDVRWSRARYVLRRAGRPPLPGSGTTRPQQSKTRRREPARPSVDEFRRTHPSRVEVSLEPVAAWLAFDVGRQQVQWLLEETIEDMFEGHPISGPNYDPTKDPNLEATLTSLAELFTGSGSDRGGASALRGLGATVRLANGISHRESADTQIDLAAGTSVRVSTEASVSGCTGLLQLRSASFDFSNPLRVRSGDSRVEISRARIEITAEGPKVEILPSGMRVTGGAGRSLAGAGALIGLLAAASNGGRSSAVLNYGVRRGAEAGGAVLAGTISGIATRAVAEALEHLRPRLKEQAPLVDWDGLFADTRRQPVCQQPVSGNR